MPILNYADETNRRALWSWQARVGLAPKAGLTTVHHHQQEHALISDELERRAIRTFHAFDPGMFRVRSRANWIEVKPDDGRTWRPIGTFDEIFRYLRRR